MKQLHFKSFLFALLLFPAFSFIPESVKNNSNLQSSARSIKNSDLDYSRFEKYTEELYSLLKLDSVSMNKSVFEKAISGYYIIKSKGLVRNPVISIVDFNKSSTQKRLWVIDLKNKKLLFHTLVAHGKNSGDDEAQNFSNTPESHMSSLGFYLTKNTYTGKHGLSLVLRGLEENINSNAEKRAIVMHGADYVSEEFIKCNGRLGRSHGCPAVPNGMNSAIIDSIKDGSVLFIYRSNYKSELLNKSKAALAYLN